MRIGLFSDTYLPATNGISYVIEILKKNLESQGHQVWIIAPRDIRWKLPQEKNVIRYPALSGIFYKEQFTVFLWPPKELKRIERLGLNAVVAFTPVFIGSFGLYCSKRLKIPYIMHYGTDLEDYAKLYKPATIGGIIGSILFAPYFHRMNLKIAGQFYRGFFKKPQGGTYYAYAAMHTMSVLHRSSSAVVATSDKIAEKLSKWPVKQDVATIPTGVNNLNFDDKQIKKFIKKYDIDVDDKIILSVGRLSIEKNLILLLEAFDIVAKKIPKAKLLLVGDAQRQDLLLAKALASPYSDRIILTGKIKRTDLGSIYALGDLFAFPSLTDCQALVLNEAAMSELPLVWCDSESLNPVLKDNVSGLQAKNNAVDFALKLELILSDKKLSKKLGAGAKRLASKLSEAVQTRKLTELLSLLVNK